MDGWYASAVRSAPVGRVMTPPRGSTRRSSLRMPSYHAASSSNTSVAITTYTILFLGGSIRARRQFQ